MGIRIGAWDCNKCGHKKIYGLEKKCTQCGSPRPEDVVFYLPEDAGYVSDEKIIAEAEAGADWICSYCNAHNPHTETHCQSCGNDRDKKEDASIQEIEYGLDDVPRENIQKRAKFETVSNSNNLSNSNPTDTNDSSANDWWATQKKSFIVLAILAVLGIIIACLAIKKDIDLTVVAFQWERDIYTEEYKEVQDEDWSLPANARLISSHEAIHHYDKVFDGYETKTRTVRVSDGTERYKCGTTSKGNGAFKDKYCTRTKYRSKTENYQEKKYKSVAVYRPKYVFWIYKWVNAATVSSKAQDKNPYWGTPAPYSNTYRERSRKERYTIELVDEKNHSYTEEMPFSVWTNTQMGQKFIGEVNLFGVFCGIKR